MTLAYGFHTWGENVKREQIENWLQYYAGFRENLGGSPEGAKALYDEDNALLRAAAIKLERVS